MPNDTGKKNTEASAAAQKSARSELHFYPGQKTMQWIVDGKVTDQAEAWGGTEPDPNVTYTIMKPQPTTAGKYVIGWVGAYRAKTWLFSKIAWGTPLKLSSDGDHVLYDTGAQSKKWAPVEDLIPSATVAYLKGYYQKLYGREGLPDKWVFNDFGPVAIRYYVDRNNDGLMNKGEAYSGEMIHTIPSDEANSARGVEFELQSSHGCIHIKPLDRDRLRRSGAFAIGNVLIVHRYDEAPLPEKP